MSSARGQSYAEEVRQLYEAALRQKQLPRHQQQQQSAAVSVCDDDALSTTTTSTSTAVMTAVGGLCWRCCRGSVDVEMPIRGRREMGSGSAGGRGRIGRWSSTGDDCESIGSGSEFATAGSPTGVCGASSLASATTSPAGSRQIGLPNAVLPDVVALAHNDEPDTRREHQRVGSTSTVNYKPKKDEAHQVSSAAGHVAR